jgi:hypothetical protein
MPAPAIKAALSGKEKRRYFVGIVIRHAAIIHANLSISGQEQRAKVAVSISPKRSLFIARAA